MNKNLRNYWKEKKVFVMKKVKESQENESNQSTGICVTIFYHPFDDSLIHKLTTVMLMPMLGW